MRAFVTGATGFIGNRLVLELHRQGWEVVCLARQIVQSRLPSVTVVAGNLLKPETLRRQRTRMTGIAAVFHCAAKLPGGISAGDFDEYLSANGAATASLVEMAESLSIPAFVYASSISVVSPPVEGSDEKAAPEHRIPNTNYPSPVNEYSPTRPTHPYSISKLAGELWCESVNRRSTNTRVASLRITSPYGPGMPENSVLSLWTRAALDGQPLAIYGTGARTQNFVFVDDVVRTMIAAATEKRGGVYALGGPESVSMRDLAAMIVGLAGRSSSLIVPAGIPDLQETVRWNVDSSAALRELGYRPETGVRTGLEIYIQSLQSDTPPSRWYHEPTAKGWAR